MAVTTLLGPHSLQELLFRILDSSLLKNCDSQSAAMCPDGVYMTPTDSGNVCAKQTSPRPARLCVDKCSSRCFTPSEADTLNAMAEAAHFPEARRCTPQVPPAGYATYRIERVPAPTEASSVPGCTDNKPKCAKWAADGECGRNPAFMHIDCAASCAACPPAGKHSEFVNC